MFGFAEKMSRQESKEWPNKGRDDNFKGLTAIAITYNTYAIHSMYLLTKLE